MAFGEGTLILSNRPTVNGVEVMATAEETLPDMEPRDNPQGGQIRSAALPRPANAPAASHNQRVQEDTEQLAMSTLSFARISSSRAISEPLTSNKMSSTFQSS